MMKIRQLTAIVMSIVMMFSISAPAFAATQDSQNSGFHHYISDDEKTSVVEFEKDGNAFKLRTEIMDNGDIHFFEYLNGNLMHRSVLYYAQSDRLHITSYEMPETGMIRQFGEFREIETTETVIMLEIPEAEIVITEIPAEDPRLRNWFTPMGTIRFREMNTSGFTVRIHGANVSHTQGAGWQSQWTIRNQQATLATWAAWMISIIGLPAFVSTQAASWVVGISGIFVSGVNQWFVGHETLAAWRVPFEFRMVNIDNPSHVGTFQAARYTINAQHARRDQIYWNGLNTTATGRSSLWGYWSFGQRIQTTMFRLNLWDIERWN